VLAHVAIEVSDLARSARFYDAVLHAIGGRRIVDSEAGIGYGRDRPELWLMPRAGARSDSSAQAARTGHVAVAAAGRRAVDAAHAAGLAAGGTDAGAPAPRSFGPAGYYSGYLIDPDGARLELVAGAH
jgi:catechol 2,3-dioxygenase-like lactoylglutathione lyase family enzyme